MSAGGYRELQAALVPYCSASDGETEKLAVGEGANSEQRQLTRQGLSGLRIVGQGLSGLRIVVPDSGSEAVLRSSTHT